MTEGTQGQGRCPLRQGGHRDRDGDRGNRATGMVMGGHGDRDGDKGDTGTEMGLRVARGAHREHQSQSTSALLCSAGSSCALKGKRNSIPRSSQGWDNEENVAGGH